LSTVLMVVSARYAGKVKATDATGRFDDESL
jgi:hypothetical protein